MKNITIDIILELSDKFDTNAKLLAEDIFSEYADKLAEDYSKAKDRFPIKVWHRYVVDKPFKGCIRMAEYISYDNQQWQFKWYKDCTKYSDLMYYYENWDLDMDEVHYLYKEYLASDYKVEKLFR